MREHWWKLVQAFLLILAFIIFGFGVFDILKS